jgi:hypothetical protein
MHFQSECVPHSQGVVQMDTRFYCNKPLLCVCTGIVTIALKRELPTHVLKNHREGVRQM